MNKSQAVFIWTEINDSEGETWHAGILPESQEDSEKFLKLMNNIKKLNAKFNNDTFSLDLFNDGIEELDTLIRNSGGSYMPEWYKLESGFTFRFSLLYNITSKLVESSNKINLSDLKDFISGFISNSEDDEKVKSGLIDDIVYYFGKKKYTKEIGSLYDLLISDLAYKMQIFD